MEQMMRRYPVGIQTFERIIKEGFIYVDKTDLVWQMAHYATFVFLSRPRRFGKSLLTSTLDSYFKGERELFEGLKIMSLEKEWTRYPVLHLDLSVAKGQEDAEGLRETLMWMMKPLTDVYGRENDETTPGKLLTGLIHRAKEKTGKQVAVIIDEYDAPLLDVLHSQATLDAMRKVMQEFYVPLKANEAFIKFCFITGITKFSQLIVSSSFNCYVDVSMLPCFATICGFTEQEVQTVFKEDIEAMSKGFKLKPQEMYSKIKLRYDGYHFADGTVALFNPFSLLNALNDCQLRNYWDTSGIPGFLIQQTQHFNFNSTSLDSLELPESAFYQPLENINNSLLLLYQYGFLTIKDYDCETETYELFVPNQEVGDTARHALEQIEARSYAKPYLTDGRKVVKVGIRFNADKHTVDEWEVEECHKDSL